MIHHLLARARGHRGIASFRSEQRRVTGGQGFVEWNCGLRYSPRRRVHPPQGRQQNIGRKTTCSCVYGRAYSPSCLPESEASVPKLGRKRQNSSTPERPSISSSATRRAAATTPSGGCSPAISASTFLESQQSCRRTSPAPAASWR